ncbi:MAG TPA: NAD-dependent epimerase/dehydratase family protein [Chloroflexota bacterium]|nr:NAD-dependent epimerase/dehydratase family protein [Chloroflexota bacterium]
MAKRILITGGAGFIGSHLADQLLAHGYEVRALDNLTPQVHGNADAPLSTDDHRDRPAYLAGEVELIAGDICDPAVVRRALDGVDAVYHLAAAVGVGQSMYQIAHYTRTNNLGTAVLLEALTRHPVDRLIVASSMSIYGEGRYCRALEAGPAPEQETRRCTPPMAAGSVVRPLARMQAGDWEVRDIDGAPLLPLPTPESHASATGIQSVYALSKFDQERLCLVTGRAYGIPTVALRFFNTYGPRQALGNPYTGVLAIFAARLLGGQPPLINEDGLQQRDFVHVGDVARACRLALEVPRERLLQEPDPVFNVGSGVPRTILEIAQRLSAVLGRQIAPLVTGTYRMGDIRHCFADISKAQAVLGYQPRMPFDEGLRDLARWLEQQRVEVVGGTSSVVDPGELARSELAKRGLAIAAPAASRQPAPLAAPVAADTATAGELTLDALATPEHAPDALAQVVR